MSVQILPHDLKRALELIRAHPARGWTLGELAASSGIAPRTLQKRFQQFVGRGPLEFLRDVRLDLVRKELLAAPRDASVTDIAARAGFSHLGRFATAYSKRYGETPSATLRRAQETLRDVRLPRAPLRLAIARPTLAVLPFEMIGSDANGGGDIADEIVAALLRLRSITVVVPGRAQYHLRGKIRNDSTGFIRITALLLDVATGRYVWADHYDGDDNDLSGLQDRITTRIARAADLSVRAVEIDRCCRKDASQLNAWELTMRALPRALSLEPAAEGMALELLEKAMELTPEDALPVALAAWCHGLRAGHHFTSKLEAERKLARTLATRAAMLSNDDPLAETFLAGGYTLAHDLETAAIHVERALMLDGGSSWAWGRSGWIEAYRGNPEKCDRAISDRENPRSCRSAELPLRDWHRRCPFRSFPVRQGNRLVHACPFGTSDSSLEQSVSRASLCAGRSQGRRTEQLCGL
jgi:AraC-like DNA-binding protein